MSFHEVEYLQISEFLQQYCIVLRWNERKRIVPIWISAEAALEQLRREQEAPAPRPTAHDLLIDFLTSCSRRVSELRIVDYEQGVFFAELITNDGHSFECRPTDGLAVAYSLCLPIMVDADVLERAGVYMSNTDIETYLDLSFADDPLVELDASLEADDNTAITTADLHECSADSDFMKNIQRLRRHQPQQSLPFIKPEIAGEFHTIFEAFETDVSDVNADNFVIRDDNDEI
ncbi:bifunctional nuclease family protein [Corynebacterium sp. HS2168-gen11]|uniref:bifunctional nuclease family protein n=1 Tax=Corynebacterium sp. HS2168-gen11 TaxID=2974027 RepID=UPI00216AC1B9|nr:bifunctional nuclease family protein [Corynebacterium sp. HS2168-gen11]MCS4535048.1 bifunctional nuclease family protein [Corynebacterium sp. HS2168-gen11]